MIRIAIDGPGGAGKSSVARAVAKRMGIIYVDTGALYRNIGLHMLESGIDPKDDEKVVAALDTLSLELTFKEGRQIILLNGRDRGDAIRTPEASMAASAVSAIKEVRTYLLNMQRDTAKHNSVIMDGRDIGTVILPDAEVKIFLTASAEARARRRYDELVAKGVKTTYEQVYSDMVERDKNDSTRDVAPCVQAEDAILLDNSDFTPDETVERVLSIVHDYEKSKNPTYWRVYKVFAPIIRFMFRISAEHTENIPLTDGLVICSNHISFLDVLSIASTSKRKITYVAKKELFSIPIIGQLIRAFGAIKIDRGGKDVGAIRASVDSAKSGSAVAIFPQGHRYPGVDPKTTPTKNGAAMIAYHSGCDVLPVFIVTKNARFGLFKKTKVIYGKPIKHSELGFENGGRDEYERVTALIFGRINELGDYSYLPAYTEKKR